jgi:hypothetical protein
MALIAVIMLLSCSGNKQPKTEVTTADSTQTLQSPARPAVGSEEAPERAAEPSQTSQPVTPQSLVGTWSFTLGPKQMVVTYNSDGTFNSESTLGGSRLELHGSYELNGNTLVSHPASFTTSDTTDAKAVKIVKELNDKIKEDPKSVTEVVTIELQGNSRFTAHDNQGHSITYTRMQ